MAFLAGVIAPITSAVVSIITIGLQAGGVFDPEIIFPPELEDTEAVRRAQINASRRRRQSSSTLLSGTPETQAGLVPLVGSPTLLGGQNVPTGTGGL